MVESLKRLYRNRTRSGIVGRLMVLACQGGACIFFTAIVAGASCAFAQESPPIVPPDSISRWWSAIPEPNSLAWTLAACLAAGAVGFLLKSLLREREENRGEQPNRFRTFFAALPVPTLIWERRGGQFILVGCNRASREILEGKAAHQLGKSREEIYPANEALDEVLREGYHSRELVQRELAWPSRSGAGAERVLVTAALAPPRGVYAFFEFIAVPPPVIAPPPEHIPSPEPVLEEEPVAVQDGAAEESLLLAIQDAPHAIAWLTPQGEFRLANSAFLRLLGVGQDALSAKNVEEWLHPGDQERLRHGLEQVRMEPAASFKRELRWRVSGGAWRLLDTAIQAVETPREGKCAWLWVQDISERTVLRHSLDARERTLRGLAEAVGLLAKHAGPIESRLQEAFPILGGAVGLERIVYLRETNPSAQAPAAHVACAWPNGGVAEPGDAGGLPWSGALAEARKRLQNGESIRGDARALPASVREMLSLHDASILLLSPVRIQGRLAGVLAYVVQAQNGPWDESNGPALRAFAESASAAIEHEETRASLRQALERAEASPENAAAPEPEGQPEAAIESSPRDFQNAFLRHLSHELRTPMNAILGFANLLARQYHGELNEKQQQYVEHIGGAGAHLLSLIHDLLDLASIDTGGLDITPAFFTAQECIDYAVDHATGEIKNKQIKLSLHVEPELPSLYADPHRTRHVLSELLLSAIKLAPSGSEITIHAEKISGEEARISVTDKSEGISKALKTNLYETFFRSEESRYAHLEGTGAGLALARRLVELQGGRIGVESEPEHGNTFWFTVPFRALTSSRRSAAMRTTGSLLQQGLIGRTVLVAEENESHLKVLYSMLRILGLEVLAARDSSETLEMATLRRPQLILISLRLSGRDGMDTVRTLRAASEFTQLPIIGMVMPSDQSRVPEWLAAGCTACIVKPVQSKDLYATLQAHLRKIDSAQR